VNDVTGIVPSGGATNPANAIPALGEYALLMLVLLIGPLGAGYAVRRTAR
jgi:IPTL-CTERM motif